MTRTPDNARIAEAAALFFTAVMADAATWPPALQEMMLGALVVSARGTSFAADDPAQVVARLSQKLTAIMSRAENPEPPTWFERQKLRAKLRFLAFCALCAPRTHMARAAEHLVAVCREELDL